MGHRQRARILGRQFDRAATISGISSEEMESRMRLVARIVDYGNVLVCTDCGHVGLHAAIAGAVEAGYAYAGTSCKEDCAGCPFVAHEWDGNTYCGLYDLKQALKRMGPKRRDA